MFLRDGLNAIVVRNHKTFSIIFTKIQYSEDLSKGSSKFILIAKWPQNENKYLIKSFGI